MSKRFEQHRLPDPGHPDIAGLEDPWLDYMVSYEVFWQRFRALIKRTANARIRVKTEK